MKLSEKIEARRKEKEKAKKKEKAKTAAVGITVGVVTGAVGGILLAPKSGKETIVDIKDTSSQISKKVSEKTSEAKLNVNKKILDNKNKFKESKIKIKEYLSNKNDVENEIELLSPEQEEVVVLEISSQEDDINNRIED